VPGVDLVITGNGHDHIVVNPDGSYRENAIVEGTAQFIDRVTGDIVATGHGMAQFGVVFSANGGIVSHDTGNDQVGGVRIHAEGQFRINPNGTITVDHQTLTCS
jgi:hypothetical protein